MARSARPRTRAGSSSSTAELMAEYSPPIPVPVRKRKKAKGANPQELAVSAVAVVYTPRVTRKSFLRPRASVRRPKNRAPRIAPSKYALADRPIWLSDKCSVEGSVSTVPTEPTRVTSSPSNIQVIPRATTTRTCHLDQGTLSSRPGILVTIQLPFARGVSSTVSPQPSPFLAQHSSRGAASSDPNDAHAFAGAPLASIRDSSCVDLPDRA